MSDPWEDQYGTEMVAEESGPWEDFSPVIRNAVPGSLTPDNLVPGVRKIGGEIAIGEPGDTHPDIIERDKIPAQDIDQRVFVGPWDEVYDREGAKQALGDTVVTEFEPNRVHSTDLIKASKEPAIKERSKLLMPPTGELSTTYGGPRKHLASYGETMASIGEGTETPLMRLVAPRPQITEPRIETPKIPIPEEAGFGEALASEMVNATLSIPDFFTSDLGIASLLAAKLSPRLVSSAFAVDLSKNAVQQAIDAYKNWDTMSPADKGKAVAGTAMSLLFGGMAGVHAIRGPRSAAPTKVIERPEGMPPEPTMPVPPREPVPPKPSVPTVTVIDSLANALEKGTGKQRIEAREAAGTSAKTIDDLEALANLRDKYRPSKKPTTPEESLAAASKGMLGQIPSESIQIAVNLRKQPGSGSLDWELNPEVAKWLVKNSDRIGLAKHPDMPAIREMVSRISEPTKHWDYSKEDLAAYQNIKSKISGLTDEQILSDQRIPLERELERIKNRYNGNPPKQLEKTPVVSPAKKTPVGVTQKVHYRGAPLQDWNDIKAGRKPKAKEGRWVTPDLAYADGHRKRSGPTGVLIELKPEANQKLKMVTSDPGDVRRQGDWKLEDVQRVTDATGKVIYEAPVKEVPAPKPTEPVADPIPAAPTPAPTVTEPVLTSVAEKAMGAAAPEEFPQPERVRSFRAFEGWTGRAKEALQRVKEYFTPPEVGALPEVEIQSGAILPRLPDYAKEKVIASAPHGMAKVPGLGALMDTRAVAHSPADAAFLARANSVSKGKTFAALWAQTQWRNKDLFQVDKDTGSFRLANGERGYLSDVIEAELRDSGSQPLTYAQWQWIHQEWKPVLDEIRRQMHNEGVQRIATEDMDFDLSTDYFPRPAIGKRNRPTTGAGGRPAGRPGAKQFFQKSRKYASEEEGARLGTAEAPKEEIIYDPDPVSRVTKFISGAYRAIADHRLANDPALGAGTVPDYWGIGRQTMAGPAFAGKIYPVEVAQKIERQFAQDIRGWVRTTGNLTSAAKALMATADLSGPFIQGAAMFGRHPVRWAKATANSYRALTDPNYVAKLMEHPRYKELSEAFSQSGGSLLQLQDFLAGLKEGQIATRIPGYGRILTATGRAYGAFLDLAKLELFDAWRKVTPKADMPRLVETIENSLFMGRMEQAGMNPHRAIGERLLLFAPSYYRGAGGLLSTALQKGVSGKMARQMLGGYASAAMLVSMSAYIALGMDWDEIKERLQPGRGKFLKIPVSLGDGERIEVGIGNILTQLVRLAGQAANYHTSNKPIDTGVEANPYLRFLRGRSAFLPGVSIELATGRDYFGNRITAKESIARHFAPFVVQSMFPRDEASFRQRAGDAAFTFFGLNAYAESDYEKARNQMDETARKIGGKPFSQLNVDQRAKVVYQFRKSPDYKKREPSPTDMERIIHLNAERQANLQKDLGDSAETLARVGLKVPGYKGTFRYKGVDVPMTESERERYQEILASMYKARIAKLNSDTLLKRPQVDREKWWSDEAEKIGIMARKRLMQEISKNTNK